jgi:hypothetical protein
MTALQNINIPAFKTPLSYYLINNITEKTCSTLANMLALDYLARLNSKGVISEHADTCVSRLRDFLGQKVITDDSFSTALTLFAIAISPKQPKSNEDSTLSQAQYQDVIIEALINSHFKDIGDRDTVKLILKDLLKDKKTNEIINYINSEPEMIRSIMEYALKKHQKHPEILNYVNIETARILGENIQLNEKTSSFKQITSKIALAISTLVVGALSVATGGTILSIAIVPTAILAVRYAPKIGEVLGDTLLNADSNIKAARNNIKSLTSELTKKNQAFLLESKQQSIEQDKSKDLGLSNIKDKSLDTIKEQLTEHMSKDQKSSQVIVQINKAQGKERGI